MNLVAGKNSIAVTGSAAGENSTGIYGLSASGEVAGAGTALSMTHHRRDRYHIFRHAGHRAKRILEGEKLSAAWHLRENLADPQKDSLTMAEIFL